jgi:predicted component of viral defense system (DUF524 family)
MSPIEKKKPTHSEDALVHLAANTNPPLLMALERIVERPHRELHVETPKVGLEELTEPDTERFVDLLGEAGVLSPTQREPIHFEHEGSKWQLTEVYDARPTISQDTYPNRFVRHVLLRYRDLLRRAESKDAAALARRLSPIIDRTFLGTVRPLTHVSTDHNVLRMHPDYRAVLQLFVALSSITSTP